MRQNASAFHGTAGRGPGRHGRNLIFLTTGRVGCEPNAGGIQLQQQGLLAYELASPTELPRGPVPVPSTGRDHPIETPVRRTPLKVEKTTASNDLSPKNTVYRPVSGALRPVAFIDWDLAAPGARIHDVAHVCWQYLGLGPSVEDASETARRLRLIADNHELVDRRELVSAILWWQDRCWRGIEAAADSGDLAMIRLRDTGAVTEVQDAYQWVVDHRHNIDRALR